MEGCANQCTSIIWKWSRGLKILNIEKLIAFEKIIRAQEPALDIWSTFLNEWYKYLDILHFWRLYFSNAINFSIFRIFRPLLHFQMIDVHWFAQPSIPTFTINFCMICTRFCIVFCYMNMPSKMDLLHSNDSLFLCILTALAHQPCPKISFFRWFDHPSSDFYIFAWLTIDHSIILFRLAFRPFLHWFKLNSLMPYSYTNIEALFPEFTKHKSPMNQWQPFFSSYLSEHWMALIHKYISPRFLIN
jgi:hypothetical protein